MDESVAMCVPIYKAHLEYGAKLLKSRKDTDNEHIRLVFGCSTQGEVELMKLYMVQGGFENVELMVIPCEHIGNKAIYKKHRLLQQLYHRFDYIACIDAESEFVKHIPTIVLADEGINPQLLGSRINSLINEQCLKNFDTTQSDVDDFADVYFWFSNIPVYCSVYLKDFYQHFKDVEKLCEKYEHFEHILYVYFLKLHLQLSNVQIVDIGDVYGIYNGWSLENCSASVLDALDLKACKMPLWCSPQAYKDVSSSVKMQMYMLYHTDR